MKKPSTIRRNSRQSTDTRKVVKLEVDTEKVERNNTRKRIKWPKSNSSEWEKLDEDMSRRLKTIIAHPREKAETHPKIILAMCKERFGEEEENGKTTRNRGPSRRQRKCS